MELTSRFGKGFSERNLLAVREFYQAWSIPQTVSAESIELVPPLDSPENPQTASALSPGLARPSAFPLPWQERFLPGEGSIRAVGVYLNLASRMRLSGPNQLWIGDITYIRRAREFVYLAVILDAFSRKVVGWSLERTLQSKLPLRTFERAIASRRPPPGVMHHSDQGVQYGCRDYMQALREHGILPSMSRPGNPYDNATCESFLKTPKREEIYANTYRDFEHLSQCSEVFIEQYYNRCRLHSALDYRSPEGFEWEPNKPGSGASPQAAMVRFFGT